MSEKMWRRLGPLLLPFSWLYGGAIYLRNLAYSSGFAPIERLPVPVISIGNLSVGGTGKTPVTLSLAQMLQKPPYHHTPGILSRGYKRKSSGYQLVSAGDGASCDWRQSGDEPQLYADKLRDVPVAVDENRGRGGQTLLRHFSLSVILLDDAFQHRRLHRDLDIVLCDSQHDLFHESLLPAGSLREPTSSLHRADLIILTHFDHAHLDGEAIWGTYVDRFGIEKVSACRIKPSGCHLLRNHENLPLEKLREIKLLPFCGLAKPEGFLSSIKQLGSDVPYLVRFSDHHSYGKKDLERLAQAFTKSGVEYLITTEKDAVKLGGLFQALPILVLEIEIEWLRGIENLQRELSRIFA